MSDLTGAVVRVMPTLAALDHIQDLHARALGVSPPEGLPAHVAFADLSDAICAVLGQIAATGTEAAGAIVRGAVVAVRRRGLDGLESILLTAFLSTMRGGFSADASEAAGVWLTRPFPDRLAGGARLVPLLDAARLTIGSVRAPELAFAVTDSGGSATLLAERLANLVGSSAAAAASEIDDPTLEPVARACADAFAATTTAGVVVAAPAVDLGLAAELAGAVDVGSTTWRGPANQLQTGKALALGIGVAGAAPATDVPDAGAIPPGLIPRRRRGPAAMAPSGSTAAQTRLVPARVTTDPPAWLTVSGRTAVLDPPRSVRPGPGGRPDHDGRGTQDFTVVRPVDLTHIVVVGTPVITLHPLTGQPINPVTGQPIGPSPGPAVAEATLLEAQQLGVDTRAVTVAEFVEQLLTTET